MVSAELSASYSTEKQLLTITSLFPALSNWSVGESKNYERNNKRVSMGRCNNGRIIPPSLASHGHHKLMDYPVHPDRGFTMDDPCQVRSVSKQKLRASKKILASLFKGRTIINTRIK